MSYSSNRSLGGHISKAHPGKSESYQKKREKYAQREPDRKLLKAA